MPTLIFTYRPKPGVPFEEFQRFLEEVDQPATLALPSTIASTIYRIVEPEEEPPSFTYVEVLEVTSFEAWERDSKRPEIQKVIEQWAKYGDVENIKVYHAEVFFKSSA